MLPGKRSKGSESAWRIGQLDGEAHLFYLSHLRMIQFHDELKTGKWHGIWSGGGTEDSWESLYEKKCMIAGTGEIGKWLARYLKMFNCNITGYKKGPVPQKMDNLGIT